MSNNPPPKSNNPLPNKERVKLPRQRMPEQDPQVRAAQLPGSEHGLHARAGASGIVALHRVQ